MLAHLKIVKQVNLNKTISAREVSPDKVRTRNRHCLNMGGGFCSNPTDPQNTQKRAMGSGLGWLVAKSMDVQKRVIGSRLGFDR